MAAPELLPFPQRAPKKHLLLLIACLAEVLDILEGLQFA